MRWAILFICFCILASCEQKSESIPIEVAPIQNKYVFVGIKVKEPDLIYSPAIELPATTDPNDANEIGEMHSVKWIENMYFSDIQEVREMNKDMSYKLMDNYESLLMNTELNSDYKLNVTRNIKDDVERNYLLQLKPKIIDRTCSEYPTYEEASNAKRMLAQIWESTLQHK